MEGKSISITAQSLVDEVADKSLQVADIAEHWMAEYFALRAKVHEYASMATPENAMDIIGFLKNITKP
jgi:hypothetical protein